MTIRVFLADDHAVLRDGLAALVEAQADMTVVGEAADGEDAVKGCRGTTVDVAVIDLSMPGVGGLEAIGQIRAHCPRTRVLVLTMHDEPRYLRAALDAGGSGYLIKRTAGREIIAAIRDVHRGDAGLRVSVSDRTMRAAVRGRGAGPTTLDVRPAPALSQREFQVLERLAIGYTNKEIAAELGLATKSVDTYRLRVQDKLGLKGRAQLVRYALDQGILKTDSGVPGRKLTPPE